MRDQVDVSRQALSASLRLDWQMSRGRLIGFLLLAGLLTRFAFFGWPTSSIIDEVYFARYVSSYFTHQYYFDVHPPLARLLVAGFAAWFDFEPVPYDTDWRQEYTDGNYLILRFLPGAFGVVFPVVIFLLAERLWRDRRLAFFIAALVVLENAVITQSRLLFWEVFQLTFGFLGLLFYCHFRHSGRMVHLALTGLCAGAAVSVKWTGISFVALPLAIETIDCLRGRLRWWRLLRCGAVILSLAATIYASAFYVHFSLLPLSGPGDAFMSREFQSGLAGNRHATDPPRAQMGFLAKLTEINGEMYRTNKRMRDHPFGSRWYQWPLGEKAVGYWRQGALNIKLQPNRVVWWSATLSMVLLAGLLVARRELWADYRVWMLAGGFLGNWLPFASIGRVMFLHSYFMALIFSLMTLGWVLSELPWTRDRYTWFLAPAAVGYLATLHLTYGIPPMLSGSP
jgi:dolichyl-phosphate-mannose-protein mannosyltransferase